MRDVCLTLCLGAGLLVQPAARSQDAQPDPAKPAFAVPKNNRQWHRLLAHARTAQEFRALSRWCDSQADVCRRKEADAEEELHRAYPVNYARTHNLTDAADGYKKQATHWSELSREYAGKAVALEAAPVK